MDGPGMDCRGGSDEGARMTRNEQSHSTSSPRPAAPGGATGMRIEALLSQQESLYARLDALGDRQSELVAAEETDRLLELLAERQGIIDGIAQVDELLGPYKTRWPAVMEALPPEERERVRRRLDALSAVMGRIARRDEADRASLQQRRDSVAVELAQIGRGRGALAAYGGPRPGASPRFQDREA